jgi:glutamate-ammonia-ligase adenylyltransferase
VAAAGADGAALADQVEALRHRVLRQRGGEARVMPDLAEMRGRIFRAKAQDGDWEAKIGPGHLQDIELLTQSFVLRAGDPARGVAAQIRAGKRAGLIAGDEAERLSSAHRLLWRLHASGRLLTDRPLDMAEIGAGGQDLLLRETGAESLDALAETLARQSGVAEQIIAAQLPPVEAEG